MKRQGSMVFIPQMGHYAALRALEELKENRRDKDGGIP